MKEKIIFSSFDDSYEKLEKVQKNLSVNTNRPIIIYGDLGYWWGRCTRISKVGYDVADCLQNIGGEDCEWMLGDDFTGRFPHHDNTHYATYRMLKEDVSEEEFAEAAPKMVGDLPTFLKYTESIAPIVKRALEA